jgi:hypothetical protein
MPEEILRVHAWYTRRRVTRFGRGCGELIEFRGNEIGRGQARRTVRSQEMGADGRVKFEI